MRGMLLTAGAVALVGCASAGKDSGLGNGTPDSGIHLVDSGGGGSDSSLPPIDAPKPIDAAPLPDSSLMYTLTETPGGSMVYSNSIACSNNTDGTTRDNIWYRAYQLSDTPMITGAFDITSIVVSVQESAGTPTITIKVGSYSGALDGTTINSAQITSLAMTTYPVPATTGQTGETLSIPIAATIPAGGKFVVQVVAPDQNTTGYFYIGAEPNTSPESHMGYISSSACSITTPETTGTASTAAGHIIINVIGNG